jgi:MtN3 and saliva related transmembrane protein
VILPIEAVGFTAGVVTTSCLFLQAWKIFVTRDTKAISLASEVTLMFGTALWTVYGLLIGSLSVILFNAVSACLAATISLLKVRLG